jgi:hypothetical protein
MSLLLTRKQRTTQLEMQKKEKQKKRLTSGKRVPKDADKDGDKKGAKGPVRSCASWTRAEVRRCLTSVRWCV